jgi:hypothetical protein
MVSFQQLQAVFLRASLGGAFGALVMVGYLFTLPFWRLTMGAVALELPIWFCAMALTYLPVTLLTAVCAHFALRRLPWSGLVLTAVCAPPLSLFSYYLWGWYMTEFAAAVDWWRGWLPPVAASLTAFALEFRSARHRDDAVAV